MSHVTNVHLEARGDEKYLDGLTDFMGIRMSQGNCHISRFAVWMDCVCQNVAWSVRGSMDRQGTVWGRGVNFKTSDHDSLNHDEDPTQMRIQCCTSVVDPQLSLPFQ
jgi:hypothetical protein